MAGGLIGNASHARLGRVKRGERLGIDTPPMLISDDERPLGSLANEIRSPDLNRGIASQFVRPYGSGQLR